MVGFIANIRIRDRYEAVDEMLRNASDRTLQGPSPFGITENVRLAGCQFCRSENPRFSSLHVHGHLEASGSGAYTRQVSQAARALVNSKDWAEDTRCKFTRAPCLGRTERLYPERVRQLVMYAVVPLSGGEIVSDRAGLFGSWKTTRRAVTGSLNQVGQGAPPRCYPAVFVRTTSQRWLMLMNQPLWEAKKATKSESLKTALSDPRRQEPIIKHGDERYAIRTYEVLGGSTLWPTSPPKGRRSKPLSPTSPFTTKKDKEDL
ncbi:hypothetical protein B0T20DRAFT_473412 [Sordaria brevicollis]|uniref:Uncharacterized protein n=1 Tax=Sordaria brevicollis TaxID=83679 RepID=A0AAE0NWH6_SORBR|nr:hypothetical protein B0T20DRAFT_473412 [Sordaria brevicollis]